MNEFKERYKSFSNIDLLRIIENKSEYQPIAIEAAETEIDERNISVQEQQEAKLIFDKEKEEKKLKFEKKAAIGRNVKEVFMGVFETIHPIQESSPSTEKLIRLTTIVFGVITIAKLFKEMGFVLYLLSGDFGSWDLSVLEVLLPFILFPSATLLFGLRKKIGWILLTSYLTYSAVSTLGLLFLNWNSEPSGIPALESLFPQTSLITYIVMLLFYGGFISILIKAEVKNSYNIESKTSLKTIGFSVVATLFLIGSYFFT
ncbi:hypothetical protein KMW28_24035 [Flammeovirga yaeyamensis]|uniref:Uncharacterized protein n=1 Tax=Flammeovirga yaeyamensis TaxID=367791 RepID=A0AAX1NFQ0_9BACT|nr:hypothetical protein [Flammeovirga yaeyamensis]MBB3696550.1 hypothetical protein [Flammeovirga yaeyamensis]NMF33228.1 hypothetical protein [Flammeovirga yaeyamensis]QWG05493.1 hypothetical protein KMW28_24035 [Flammeovirga yaeyamensis]